MSDTRMPTQKRSIEKRNKIIEKGFELICEKGYYNTTTADIAEYANVSTGIVYQYFNDKKDIFIEGVKIYSNSIMYPMLDIIKETNKINIGNIDTILEDLINKFIEVHTISKKAHEELIAMSHLDDDIFDIFRNSELELTEKIVSLLEQNNIIIENAHEKIHIAYGLVDNLCHEIVYHNHDIVDYNIMKKEVIQIIANMLR